MSLKIVLFITLAFCFQVFGQEPHQLIVSSVVKTDRTIQKLGKSLFETKTTRYQIIYNIDSVKESLTAYRYIIENYRSLWNGKKIVKNKKKTKYIKWFQQVDTMVYDKLFSSLYSNSDTSENTSLFERTSHHYQTIYIDVVAGNDTTSYYKSKPFDLLTPWFSEKKGYIINPEIDRHIYNLLPEKFLGRNLLLGALGGAK